ncbi:hypothetical protein ACRALDRAFT_1070505 [Sodiomyces alcalophilus JCM 7366]|uniref:uncharacterized protein n=1 Tax=Sodiomyces alcalophilus JCM 7366 TaxID=591952 RepID=UPI0039B6CDD2
MAYRQTQTSVPGAVTWVRWNRAPGPDTNTMNPNHAAPATATQPPRSPADGHHGEQASARMNNLNEREPFMASHHQYAARYGYEMSPPATQFNSGHLHFMPNYHDNANDMLPAQGLTPRGANLAVGHGRSSVQTPVSEVDNDLPYPRVPTNTPSAVSATPHHDSGLGSSSVYQPSSATTPFSMAADSPLGNGYTFDLGHGRFTPSLINGFGNQTASQYSPTDYKSYFDTYQMAGFADGRDGNGIVGSPVPGRHGVSGRPPTVPPPSLMHAGLGMSLGSQVSQSQLFRDARIGQMGQMGQNGQNSQSGQNGLAALAALAQASAFRTTATPTLPAPAPTALHPAIPSSSAHPGNGNNNDATAPGASNQVARPLVNQVTRFINSQVARPRMSFLPSNAVLRSAGYDPMQHNAHELAEIKIQHGISPNYQGDPTIARNHSANIPQSQNCSFWIVNLPPRVTTHELLSQIRNIGRIFACVINAPQPERGHCTAAAKVVFFDLWAAQRFYATSTRCRLVVGGYRTRVSLNRIRSAEAEGPGNRTRVIVLKGDPSFVNETSLTAWFSERFKFEVDEVITHVLNEHIGHVEYRFGSWRCQAETARVAIIRELGYDSQNPKPECPVWEMKFGLDPCAPLPTSALI